MYLKRISVSLFQSSDSVHVACQRNLLDCFPFIAIEEPGANPAYSRIVGYFDFCSDLPNFWHVSYRLIGKHFSVFFFLLVFLSFSRYSIYKKTLEKQKASFVDEMRC